MKEYILTINSKELLNIFSKYYSDMYGKEIIVKEHIKVSYEGYYEEKVTNVEFYYEEYFEVLGNRSVLKTVLDREEINGVLNEVLNSKNYELESINYLIENDDSFGRSTKKFNGVKIKIKQKQNVLSKKM